MFTNTKMFVACAELPRYLTRKITIKFPFLVEPVQQTSVLLRKTTDKQACETASKIKPWVWFVGIYVASVAVIATFELGSHWLLSFLM